MRLRFELSVQLDYVAAERCTFLLNIHPARTARQSIVREALTITGEPPIERWVDPGGNRWIRLQAGPGPVVVRYDGVADVDLHLERTSAVRELAAGDVPPAATPYVLPSRYCQSDRLMDFARSTFGTMDPGLQRARAIADWVTANVRFQPGVSDWTTSAIDTLERRVGVCRDFAHLMIGICRALNMPARFVTGVDYGADPALGPLDFHAYVEVYLGDRWYVFDPSGLCPEHGLLRIGTGRDAADVAFATLFGAVTAKPPGVSCRLVDERGEPISLGPLDALAVSSAGSDDDGRADPGMERRMGGAIAS